MPMHISLHVLLLGETLQWASSPTRRKDNSVPDCFFQTRYLIMQVINFVLAFFTFYIETGGNITSADEEFQIEETVIERCLMISLTSKCLDKLRKLPEATPEAFGLCCDNLCHGKRIYTKRRTYTAMWNHSWWKNYTTECLCCLTKTGPHWYASLSIIAMSLVSSGILYCSTTWLAQIILYTALYRVWHQMRWDTAGTFIDDKKLKILFIPFW